MTRRYVRPAAPQRGLILGARDRLALAEVARFRYLTAAQLRTLVAPSTAVRVFQRRLRLLYEHHYLDRDRLPATARERSAPGTPLYSLAEAGSAVLEDAGAPWPRSPSGPPPSTIHHALVATDFLVAVHQALRSASEGRQATLHPEATLWTALARWRLGSHVRRPAIVPDGAVTLPATGGGAPSTYALEVVRADIRGGSRTFIAKLGRYGELVRSRFFRDAFGFARLRAVIVATPTVTRARHLRELAANAALRIPVVFTAYRPSTPAFTAESIGGPAFTDTRGAPFTLLDAVCSS